MFVYYLKLSLRNFKRNPLLFGLIIITLAVGVGLTLTNIAIIQSMANDPLPHKSNRVFSVGMNTWPSLKGQLAKPNNILRYQDAIKAVASELVKDSAIHYQTRVFAKNLQHPLAPRFNALARSTNSGFFRLAEAPFAFGGSWSDPYVQEVVISAKMNETFLGGGNNVGTSLEIDGQIFKVVGILKPWVLKPRFYEIENGHAFDDVDDLFVPLEVSLSSNWGNLNATFSAERFDGLADSRQKNVFFLRVFVELNKENDLASYVSYLDNHTKYLKSLGQHPLAAHNQVIALKDWFEMHKVVDEKIIAFGVSTLFFLLVCIFNSSSLLLSYNNAIRFENNLKRALGASQRTLFYQHSVESCLIGLFSACLALFLCWMFLKIFIALFPHLKNVSTLEFSVLLIAAGISLVTAFISTLYAQFRLLTSDIAIELK